MPEGPEIRRAADALEKVLAGRRALEVSFAFARLKRFEAELTGRKITGVAPRGKAMLIHFAGGLSIYSHNQLYGEWTVYPGAPPDSHLQQRLVIRTSAGTAVLYSASEISVQRTGELAHHPYIVRLGLDLLGADATPAAVLAQVKQPRFARRRLAGLLLDQGFLAGLGNYLRSEILFAASLHPDLVLGDLSAAQHGLLARTALAITRRAYRTAGVTNALLLARRLKARGLSFREYRFAVFERTGAPCYVCGTTIRRLERGRAVFICPHCQALPDAEPVSSAAARRKTRRQA
jgi:endonuclease-8